MATWIKHIKFPIAWKLSSMTLAIVLASMIPTAFEISALFKSTSIRREEDGNREQASDKALEYEILLDSLASQVKIIGNLILKTQTLDSLGVTNDTIQFNLEQFSSMIKVRVLKVEGRELLSEVTHKKNIAKLKLPENYTELIESFLPFPIDLISTSVPIIRQRSPSNEISVLTIGLPLVQSDDGLITVVAIADFDMVSMNEIISGQGYRRLFLIDELAQVLNSNTKDSISKETTETILKSKVSSGQIFYKSEIDQQSYFSAYAKNKYGLAVIAEIPESVVLEPTKAVNIKVAWITSMVIFGSLIVIYFVSVGLTKPLKLLTGLLPRIAAGEFHVRARNFVKSHDEVGALAQGFDNMIEGLRERDKVKNLFNKFHGTTIADALLASQGDAVVGGAKRMVVVFFSDIRGFTTYSEMHGPEEVVSMLNEYFSIMVKIITQNHGVVDKFIGDAIMAVWGAPSSTGDDAYYALKACIEMRNALKNLNILRSSRSEPPLQIGMGLHQGEAISGVIGSQDRMEYTVIGDAVNITSRIEGKTKDYDTDILVSHIVYEQVKSRFELELVGEASLKGKSGTTTLYKVNKENYE